MVIILYEHDESIIVNDIISYKSRRLVMYKLYWTREVCHNCFTFITFMLLSTEDTF